MMKPSHFILRALTGLALGLALSVALTTLTFDYQPYGRIDRAFLFIIPALAFGWLFFLATPHAVAWAQRIQNAAMLVRSRDYAAAWVFSATLGYGLTGFFDAALANWFITFLFALVFVASGAVGGYYLFRRAKHSLQTGFLGKPLNLALCGLPPVLLLAVGIVSLQFPHVLQPEDLTVAPHLLGGYGTGALLAIPVGLLTLKRFDYETFQTTRVFSFVRQNLPGLYLGGVYVLIHLVLARALNHPALGHNSVLFETDAGPWMEILASPQSAAVNRAVHPLTLIVARPLMRLFGVLMGAHWNLAGMLVVALLSGACVTMTYVFVKRATGADTYAFLFALLLGSTPAHLLFGSLTENYVFGMTALICFFLLIQAGERRATRLVPLGVIVFGITVTNLAQTAIGLLSVKFGFWKTVRYGLQVVAWGVTLTLFVHWLYPNAQTFFFVPADLAFEGNFVKAAADTPQASAREKLEVATRTMLFYEIVAPEPLVVVSQKKSDPFPTVDLKTYDWRERKLASYKGLGNLPLGAWLVFLVGAVFLFFKNARTSPHTSLALGLLGCLGFNFLMHNFYGTELFLYVPYWAYALIFFTALAYASFAGSPRFEIPFALLVLIVAANNLWFIFVVLRALAPFFVGG